MIRPYTGKLPEKRISANLTEQVLDFMRTGMPCGEIDIEGYKDSHSAAASYACAVRRLRVPAYVTSRDGRAFIVRRDAQC